MSRCERCGSILTDGDPEGPPVLFCDVHGFDWQLPSCESGHSTLAAAKEVHRRDMDKAMGWFLLYGPERAAELCREQLGFDPSTTGEED